jgi:translation initiation factor 6 (eIF-6)
MKPSTLALSKGLQKIAKDLDTVIENVAGERTAFTLMVFTEGRASYISSASREESVKEIKTLLALWDEQMPDTPAHEYN